MDVIQYSSEKLTLDLTFNEALTIQNVLNEVLNALGRSEFQTRIGSDFGTPLPCMAT